MPRQSAFLELKRPSRLRSLPSLGFGPTLSQDPWPGTSSAPKKSRFTMVAGQRQLAWELSEISHADHSSTGYSCADFCNLSGPEDSGINGSLTQVLIPDSEALESYFQNSNTWSRIEGFSVAEAQKRNSFGSCQARKIFPFIQPYSDRLGNEHIPIRGDPDRGPGTYNHGERTTLLYNLIHKPESRKGYSMGARTASRFGLESKHATPAPTAYQIIRLQELKHPSSHAVFASNLPRFPAKIPDSELFPGPGTYDPYKMPHRHVTWPGKFGSPDWSLVPAIPKRTLRTELITDREFRKYRNLVAYLSIYYDE